MLTLEEDLLHVIEWQSYMDCDVLIVYRDISLLYENFMCCKVIFAIKKQNIWYFRIC